MCGIIGIINFNNIAPDRELIKTMADELRHRGPDGEGFYFNGNIGLGHRRLAIIDLSENAHQPMSNEDKTIWLIFNGEIYNYKDMRNELKAKGHRFKSNTDSEIIIHAYEEYGKECVKRFNGMWAFAIWDKRAKSLFLSRDRLGIKPLYYYIDNNKLIFASEIRAILLEKTIPRRQNDRIIFDFLAFENNNYIDHSEETFFSGIKRLMPANNMVVDTGGGAIKLERYWDLDKPEKRCISDAEAASAFYELFEDSIRLRLQSDVPVGTCLSGGLDSSSIVGVVNNLIKTNAHNAYSVGERQKTFSAFFSDRYCDESEYVDAVIKKTGVDAYKIYPEKNNLFDLAEKFIVAQGEPVTSTSQWAGWLVMKLASENGVKVVLNGQGADEILAGYSSYLFANTKDMTKHYNFIKVFQEIKDISEKHGYSQKRLLIQTLKEYMPTQLLTIVQRFFDVKEDGFPNWLSGDFIDNYAHKIGIESRFDTHLKNSLYHYLTFERLPSLLRYEDRNSMAFSLESRLPFLDYRLVEYCFSLPADQKIRSGVGKIVLRNALKEILPENVARRIKKIGFFTPEKEWLGKRYVNEAREIINSNSFKGRGYFDIKNINKHYESFVKGMPVNMRFIWRYINLELWFRNCVDK